MQFIPRVGSYRAVALRCVVLAHPQLFPRREASLRPCCS
jgi:hypothetical protein